MSKVKDQANLAVALKGTTIPAALAVIDQKLSAVKKITESVYKTSGKVDSFTVSLKDEQLEENVIRMLSVIVLRNKAYDEAAALLGVSSTKLFKYNGSPLEDWVEDAKLRINIINNHEQETKLKEFKDKLSKFMSEEDQKELLFQEIGNYFK